MFSLNRYILHRYIGGLLSNIEANIPKQVNYFSAYMETAFSSGVLFGVSTVLLRVVHHAAENERGGLGGE